MSKVRKCPRCGEKNSSGVRHQSSTDCNDLKDHRRIEKLYFMGEHLHMICHHCWEEWPLYWRDDEREDTL